MKKNYVINIGRQLGSGGRLVGEKLAEQLGIGFYDKELILLASKESGLGKEFFERADEKTRFGLFGDFFGWFGSALNEGYYNENSLRSDSLFRIQSDVIRRLAKEHSCLFVGRCADYILREHTACLNVFISADIEDRIGRVTELQNTTHDKALETITRVDKQRAAYYNYYTGKAWGHASSYHLCINSSVLGIDETVNYIRSFAEKKFV